ncbi:18817_t:CDS:2, partial [Racocetra persica]
FVKEMVKLLELFETIIKKLSSASYPTLNMVYLYIYILKQIFAPKIEDGKTIDSYLDLIYRLLVLNDNLKDIEDDNNENENTTYVKYLSPANTENLIQRVHTAIYLSLDKL